MYSGISVEAWVDVPGYEGIYKVSDFGRVKRLAGSRNCSEDRILKPHLSGCGYYYICLCRDGTERRDRIHGLVLTSFYGPRPEGKECAHRNGNPLDNRLSNLRWLTHAENMAECEDHGNRMFGENHTESKLRENQVLEIMALKGVKSQRQLAREYGVSRSAIAKIHQGRAWRYLTR